MVNSSDLKMNIGLLCGIVRTGKKKRKKKEKRIHQDGRIDRDCASMGTLFLER